MGSTEIREKGVPHKIVGFDKSTGKPIFEPCPEELHDRRQTKLFTGMEFRNSRAAKRRERIGGKRR